MKRLFINIIYLYQKLISPLFPPTCRYYPTCSNYAILAIKKHGAICGSLMAFFRILRCQPFVHGGFDPVSEKFSLRRNTNQTDIDKAKREFY